MENPYRLFRFAGMFCCGKLMAAQREFHHSGIFRAGRPVLLERATCFACGIRGKTEDSIRRALVYKNTGCRCGKPQSAVRPRVRLKPPMLSIFPMDGEKQHTPTGSAQSRRLHRYGSGNRFLLSGPAVPVAKKALILFFRQSDDRRLRTGGFASVCISEPAQSAAASIPRVTEKTETSAGGSTSCTMPPLVSV